MTAIDQTTQNIFKQADWELDFYSRPILEPDGKKRWELLISSTQDFSGEKPFRWEKICPANEVNSLWLSKALKEALEDAEKEGWRKPSKLRFWRSSMKTMIKRSAESHGIDSVSSRRTYSLFDWLAKRESEIYPNQPGYIAGPLAPPISPILNQSVPLPEAIRGDAWAFATLSIQMLREANDWPMEFNSLIPIRKTIDGEVQVPGIRLFSRSRALALAAWLGGLEPVKIVLEKNQLILESGQEERWLITDMDPKTTDYAKKYLDLAKEQADGLQFISVQSTPEKESFTGFWMLRDLPFN